MSYAPLVAVVVSAIVVGVLCRSDPKRRRAAGSQGTARRTLSRRWLAALTCVPGLYLVGTADAAGFLVWLGGTGLTGWLIVLGFGAMNHLPRPAARPASPRP